MKLAWLIVVGAATAAHAGEQASVALPRSAELAALIEQSLAARPEIAAATERIRAERQAAPQARALPDPMLEVGIQNDGFTGIELGKMETSWVSIMASQTLPWPGKLKLRGEIAELAPRQVEQRLARLRLSTEAEVQRAYLDLLLARDRLALVDELEDLWRRSAGLARSRYEVGDGAQSDLLRAQLELNRVKQRRWAVQVDERQSQQALNRLRAVPLDTPVETRLRVKELAVPGKLEAGPAVDDAVLRSPEIAEARLAVVAAERQLSLAKQTYAPDLTFRVGVMPRGGSFPPMWLASVGGTLPVYAPSKQARGVEEGEARLAAARADLDAMERTVALRVHERVAALAAWVDTIQLFREGLLVQSQATAESTLAQYKVGRVTFISVLEANVGYISDQEQYLRAIVSGWRAHVGQAEVSVMPGDVGLSPPATKLPAEEGM